MKIYIGNLPFGSTDSDLSELFTDFGDVESASIITDKETGESKGFGFVEMVEKEAAKDAIQALNGSPLNGRNIKVNVAKSRNNSNRNKPRKAPEEQSVKAD